MVTSKWNSVLYIWNIANIHKLKTVSHHTSYDGNPRSQGNWRSCHNGERQETTWHWVSCSQERLLVVTALYTGSQRALHWNLTGCDCSPPRSLTNSCLLSFISRDWQASALCSQTPPPLTRHTDHLSAVVDLNTIDLVLILQTWIKLNHPTGFLFNPSVFRKTWLQQTNSWFHSLEIR